MSTSMHSKFVSCARHTSHANIGNIPDDVVLSCGRYLKTSENHGYIILDVERKNVFELKSALRRLPHTIWCRSLLRTTGEFGSDEDVRAWAHYETRLGKRQDIPNHINGQNRK